MDWDDAYANATHIPGGADFPAQWRRDSDAFRKTMSVLGRARLGVMYGHGPREVVDIFLPDRTPKGVLIFVHGGFWRMFDGASWSHFAKGAQSAGWVVAMPTYDLCPRVRIADITRQIAQAISVVAHEFAGPIRLCGHSAGGHLVSRMLAPGLLPKDVLSRIQKSVPISPVADLRPLLNTRMNDDFQLDAASAAAESPVLMPAPSVAVTVWVGGDERPAFLDQARWLAEAWNCEHIIEPGKHHFDVINGLLDANSPLMRSLLEPVDA
ncbi:alpha/beta hydrolase [Marivita sp. S0852]|uniref:alpha/beta hydrolase n=1 Tax=Marivita sp. S0852 TaxID=3373893 RepID=UPI003981E525